MNRGYFGQHGRTNTGIFLRRGRIPPPHIISATPHYGYAIGSFSTGGTTPLGLTTAYSFGVSGQVRALRFISQRDQILTRLWYATGSNTGTPTGALTVEVRGANAANPGLLPGTLLATESSTPTANSWNLVNLTTPLQLTANTIYFVIVGDAAGNATNYYRVWDNTGGNVGTLGQGEQRFWAPINTSNGFSTAGNILTGGMVSILGFADGTTYGMIQGGGGTPASNTFQRGYYLSNFETDIELYGMVVGSSTNWNAISIYGGDQGPNQSPLYTESMTADNRALVFGYLRRPFRLRVGNAYRVVMGFSGASSSPGQNVAVNSSTVPVDNVGLTWGCLAIPTLATANGWTTGYKDLGITNYGMVLLVRRVMDPRV